MSSPFNNIVIIGASGAIGSVILEAFLNTPSVTITILQRASSSKTIFPPSVRVVSIPDNYPHDSLVAAFTNQDAVINCVTTLAVRTQLRIISAAAEAGVRRFVPSEYGLNNNNPAARALCSVFREKGEVQDYLRTLEDRMEWMSFAVVMWLKWSATHEFLGMHIAEKKFVLWDDGEGLFSTTTEENTALAVVNALTKKWEETKNKVVWLSDFAVSQKKLLEAVERYTGEKFKTELIDSESFTREKQSAAAAGDGGATYSLIETGFVTGKYGGYLEKEGEIMNELLGLPKRSLDEVVKAAVEAVEMP
jgi:nucleoside-diphosphate-sugar epimerase